VAEWSYSAIDQVQTPGGNVSCNAGSGDTLFIVPGRSLGLGESDIRGQDDEKGQADGLLLHPRFLGGHRISLYAIILIRSSGTDAGYLTARDSFIDDMRTKLKSAVNVDGALHFAGGGSYTVRTRALGPPVSDQPDPAAKSVFFQLVSATSA
jgi:hypothetical protein